MATVVVVPEGGTMAEQYQRQYENGRRGRDDRGDSGRWSGDDARMHPHDVHEDGRYDGDGQRYGGGSHMSGRDTRQEYESRGRGGETPGRSSEWGSRADMSRGTEWSAGGRGGYGSESGDYEPNRWRDTYSPQGSGRYDTQPSQSWRSQGDGWRDSGRGYGDESGNMSRYGGGQYGGRNPGRQDYGQGHYGQGGRGDYGQSAGQYGAESWRGYGDESRGGAFGRNWSDVANRQGNGRQSASTFAGRGPKDYQRSDERIREEVSDRMTDDHDLDASEISVEVRGGEVTLTGTVRTRDQKRRAEDLAEQCSGVGEVTNNIRVKSDDSRGQLSRTSSGPSASDSSQSMSGANASASTGNQSGTSGHGQTVTPTPKTGRQSGSNA